VAVRDQSASTSYKKYFAVFFLSPTFHSGFPPQVKSFDRMDPLSVTLAVVTFATALKEIIELSQKIEQSFSKVSPILLVTLDELIVWNALFIGAMGSLGKWRFQSRSAMNSFHRVWRR